MQVAFSPDDLRPLVDAAVDEAVSRLAERSDLLAADRLAYPEAEAARLLGVAKHVLGDARRRGEVRGSRCGKKIVYTRAELNRFLDRQQTGGPDDEA